MSTPNEKIEIISAVLRDDLFITAIYSVTTGNEVDEVKRKCSAPAHDDLRKAFRRLTPHLALISEQVKICESKKGRTAATDDKADSREKLMDPEEIFTFTDEDWKIVTKMDCTGFKIVGAGDSEGVALDGDRVLRTDKTLSLSGPSTKYNETNGIRYAFANQLAEDVETVKAEVYAYLFDGKHAPDNQMSLEFPEDGDETGSSYKITTVVEGKETELNPDAFDKAAKRAARRGKNAAAGDDF